MALNITITSEIIKTALSQLTFREHDKQKIEIVDGVFAEVQMYNHTLFVDMTAKGWWARGMATLRFEYSMYTKDETPNLRDKSFNTSGGGIDGTEDFESYCAAMERRGLVHIAIAMIAEELNTPEFQEKITEAIKVDYALRLERQEKARVKREEEEKQKQAEITKKYNKWLETNTPLSEEGAKQEIKKVTQMNASKEDAEHFVTKQKIKVTSFCQNSGEVETQFFTVSHDYGRNTWTWEDNGRGEKPEGIAAKKVVQFMINSVVELVD